MPLFYVETNMEKIPVNIRTRETHEAFVHSEIVFIENEMPVSTRWAACLVAFEELRGLSLTDDLTEIYQKAYVSENRYTIERALDLVCLQSRFFEILANNRLIPNYIIDFISSNGVAWQMRLHELRGTVRPTRRVEGRVHKGKQMKKPNPLTWMN